jgi:hypothetical protein
MAKVDIRIERRGLEGIIGRTEMVLSAWETSAREKIESYFKRIAGENIQITGPLVLSVEQFKCIVRGRTFDREVRGTLSVIVDGQQKSENFHCVRYYDPRRRGSRLSGESGNQWIETVRDVISGDRAAVALTPEVIAEDPFFSLLNVSLLETADKMLGRNDAGVVTLWRILQAFVWLAVIAAVVFLFFKTSSEPLRARLIGGAIVGFVTYLVAYALSACCMPAYFFENYGAGQRAMRIMHMSNGQETQTMIRTITGFVIFSLALVAYVTYRTFH